MLARIIWAGIYGIAAWLICMFVGGLLVTTGVPLGVFIGGFLVQWAVVISILVALATFFGGGAVPSFFRRA